jgi:drug/metabolite transporter (DMT)-like permease
MSTHPQAGVPVPAFLGPLRLSLAVLCFASLDTLSKYLSPHYPVTSLVWMRYLVQTVLLAAFVGPRMGFALVRTRRPVLQILRALCLLGASLCVVTAVRYLPLAELTSIVFLTPVIICVISIPILGEKVGTSDWVAVIIGFIGVLVIVRPGGQMLTFAALLPLCAAVLNSLYQVLTRHFSASEHPSTTNFITGLVGTVLLAFMMPEGWTPPGFTDGLLIVGMGVSALAGHLLLTRAYQVASPAVLAPYSYGQILWATVLGYLVFDMLPDSTSSIGMAIIAFSGLYVSYHRLSTKKARP